MHQPRKSSGKIRQGDRSFELDAVSNWDQPCIKGHSFANSEFKTRALEVSIEKEKPQGYLGEEEVYLRQIGAIPRLSQAEEKALCLALVEAKQNWQQNVFGSLYVQRHALSIYKAIAMGNRSLYRALQLNHKVTIDEKTAEIRKLLPRLEQRISKIIADRSSKAVPPILHDKTIRSRKYNKEIVEILRALELRNALVSAMIRKLKACHSKMEVFKKNGNQSGLARLILITGETPTSLKKFLLRATESEAEYNRIKKKLTEANLRLVVSVAKKYRNRGVSFLDLIQCGNTGLIRGIERFQPELGNKLSTYCVWWIRQAITREIEDKRSTIRIPVHLRHTSYKLELFEQGYKSRNFGRIPSSEECAQHLDITVKEVEKIRNYNRQQNPSSIDQPVNGTSEVSFEALIPDRMDYFTDPLQAARIAELRDATQEALSTLSPREYEMLCIRYGLDMRKDATYRDIVSKQWDNQLDETHYGQDRTLDEIAATQSLTRERIRQITSKAGKKLMTIHPKRANLQRLASHFPASYFQKLADQPAKRNVSRYENPEHRLPLSDLNGLPIRTLNALESRGIYLLGDLLNTPTNSLLSIKNMGPKSLRQIYDLLEDRGYSRNLWLPISELDLPEEMVSKLMDNGILNIWKLLHLKREELADYCSDRSDFDSVFNSLRRIGFVAA